MIARQTGEDVIEDSDDSEDSEDSDDDVKSAPARSLRQLSLVDMFHLQRKREAKGERPKSLGARAKRQPPARLLKPSTAENTS